jgi:hypothetical protein
MHRNQIQLLAGSLLVHRALSLSMKVEIQDKTQLDWGWNGLNKLGCTPEYTTKRWYDYDHVALTSQKCAVKSYRQPKIIPDVALLLDNQRRPRSRIEMLCPQHVCRHQVIITSQKRYNEIKMKEILTTIMTGGLQSLASRNIHTHSINWFTSRQPLAGDKFSTGESQKNGIAMQRLQNQRLRRNGIKEEIAP